MLIETFVTRSEILTVRPDDTISEAASRMHERGVGSAVVAFEDGVPGIITERDVLRAVGEGKDPKAAKVEEYMTAKAVGVNMGWRVTDAARTMIDRGFRHLIVLDREGEVIGMLSIRDMMRAMLDERTRTLAG